MILYRAMKKGTDNKPVCGNNSGRELGIRINIDIEVDSDDYVYPGTGGMSVSPPPPSNLPEHRRPVELNGTGKDPLWKISSEILSQYRLQYRPDPQKPNQHGFIEPIEKMLLHFFQMALTLTSNDWELGE